MVPLTWVVTWVILSSLSGLDSPKSATFATKRWSNKILLVLTSLCMMGGSARSCKYCNPLAAPSAICNLCIQSNWIPDLPTCKKLLVTRSTNLWWHKCQRMSQTIVLQIDFKCLITSDCCSISSETQHGWKSLYNFYFYFWFCSTWKAVFEGTIHNILINQHLFILVETETNKPHNVLMMNSW